MRIVRPLGAAVAFAALTACVSRPAAPAPRPAPAPVSRPVPQPPSPSLPAPVDWQDAPLSPGDWTYRRDDRPLAVYQSDRTRFAVSCASNRRILIGLGGAASTGLTIRTSFGERRLPATVQDAEAIAELQSSDPLFDELAFSRGRFLVRADGRGDLILPTWPELARVIEDCRQ